MANKNTISIELVVDDKGTVVIKQFGQSTEQTLRRAESASSQAADSMSSHWRSVATTLGGVYTAYKVADFAKDSALMAARYETLGVVMGVVGNNAGYTYAQMDQFSRSLQANGISMIESRQSLTRMAQAQLDLSKSSELARVAQDAAVIGNINSSEAFERLIVGIQTGQVEILRTIGINVNFEESYKKLAKQTGRTVESLTEAEKAAARMGAALDSGKRIAGTYAAAMMTAGKQLTSFSRYVDDYKVLMGQAFGPATSILVSSATDAMKRMQEEIAKPEAQKALRDLSVEMANVIRQLGEGLPGAIGKTTAALNGAMQIYNALPSEIVGGAGVGILGRILFGAWGPARALAAAYMAASVLEKVGKSQEMDFVGTVTTVAKTMIASPFSSADQTSSANINTVAEFSTTKQLYQDNFKALEEARKRNEEAAKARTEANAKATQSVVDATRKAAYEIDTIGLGQYDKDIARINAEAAKYAAAGADRVKVAEFVSTETALAQAKEAERWSKEYLASYEKEKKAAEDYYAAVAKEQEKIAEDVYVKEMELFEETEKANEKYLKDTEKASLERLKIERDLFSDLRGYETDYYDASVKLLDDQVKAYRDQNVSKNAIDAWRTEEMAKLDLRRLKSSDKLVDGVNAGYKEMLRNQETWAKTGLAVFDSFYRGASSQLSANLVNVFRGKFGEIGFDWASLQDSMLTSFSNSLGKMITEATINEVVLFFKTTWAEGGKNVLGIIDKILGFGTSLLGGSSDSNESYLGTAFGDQYSWGGRVPALAGAAPYAGDHPGNDNVLAWLSPDEMVIRRTSVNDRTIGILDYINRTGSVPGLAYGGTPGIVTNEQGRGYWGFGDIFGGVMGAVFNPVASFADWGKEQVGSAYNWISDNILTSENLGMLSKAAAIAMATYIAGPYGYGAVAAAGTAGAQQAAISSSKGSSFSESIKSGLISALATYAAVQVLGAMSSKASGATPDYGWSAGMGGAGETGLVGKEALAYGSSAFTSAARELGLSDAQALSLWDTSLGGSSAWGEVIKGRTLEILAKESGLQAIGFGKGLAARGLGITPAEGGAGHLSISYEGANDGGLFSSLYGAMGEIAPQARPFAFSARNGLDYVPYDDFPVLTHRGERIQTAKEAEATRRDGGRPGLTINAPLVLIQGNLVADKNTFDDFVEKIDVALEKKWRLVRG